MTKKTFTIKGHRANECLKLVHADMYEPFSIHAQEGYGYFATFIDEYSKFGYVYLIRK